MSKKENGNESEGFLGKLAQGTAVNVSTWIITGTLTLMGAALLFVGAQLLAIRDHVVEVPDIKAWVGYANPALSAMAASERIDGLEAQYANALQELMMAQVQLDQLLGPVDGEATRQNPGQRRDVGILINRIGDARRFVNEPALKVTNASNQLSQTIPVVGSYRFDSAYEDAEIMLTVPASTQLGWDSNAMRMNVTVERIAD